VVHQARDVVIEHEGKSGADYPESGLPRYAVRNHLLFLQKLGPVPPMMKANVALRHLLYLYRWKHASRGIKSWWQGLQEFNRRQS